jgi:hypothetical protein
MKNALPGETLLKSLEATTVEVCIRHETDLYNPFSVLNAVNDNAKINEAVIEYIVHETEKIPIENRLEIVIQSVEKVQNSVAFTEQRIKENVAEKIAAVSAGIRKACRNAILLATAGMVLIGSTQVFQLFEKRYALNEFIIVMSWVFMWKAVELFFFDRSKLMKKLGMLFKVYYSTLSIR